MQVNPNNASFNAFELYFNYDPSKVGFQNTSNFSQNILSPYPILNSSVDTNTNSVTIVGTRVNGQFSGSTDIEMVRIKMKVMSGAAGTMDFYWSDTTRLGNKIQRELFNNSFQIGGVGAAGPDLHVDIPALGGGTGVQRGQQVDVGVYLKTDNNPVKAIDFVLPYDDTKFTFPNTVDILSNIVINPNSGFNTQFVIKKVDTVLKRIIVSLVVPVQNGSPVPVSSPSDILVATIKFVIKPTAPLGSADLLPDIQSAIFNTQDQKIIRCVGGYRLTVVTPSTPTVPPPTPTPGLNTANLSFKLQFPNIISGEIPASKVQIELRDGANVVDLANINLVRNGSYFQTAFDIFFTIPQNKAYTVLVKTTTGLRRIFTGVNLIKGVTLDCTLTNNSNCGELITQRDSKLMFSGDSDGFDTASGSYNKIDSADVQVLSIFFNSAAAGPAAAADFNLDGQVSIDDLEILGRNYGFIGD